MKVTTPEGLVITLSKGSIATEQCNVIVDTTSKDLDLRSSAVGRAIVEQGGESILDECKSKAPDGVDYGEILCTSGGQLPVDVIYHSVFPQWDGDNGTAVKTLEEFINTSLSKASNDGHTSLAFPAIGTGNLKYPREKVAEIFRKQITQFSSKNPNTKVKDVRIVLYDKDVQTIDAFTSVFQGWKRESPRKSLWAMLFRGFLNPEDEFEFETVHQTTGGLNILTNCLLIDKMDGSFEINVGKQKVTVLKGDITQTKVDAIVNSTTSNLDNSIGPLARAISKAAGSILDQECQKYVSKHPKIGQDVVKTQAGKMPCQSVLHVSLEKCSIQEAVINVLCFAEENSISSVAFPTLGAGIKNCSPKDLADQFVKAVAMFNSTLPQVVKSLSLVVWEDKTFSGFKDALMQRLQAKQSVSSPPPLSEVSLGRFQGDTSDVITIVVEQGDITKETTDAIVNITNDRLDLGRGAGAVATAISRQGGTCIQQELNKKGTPPFAPGYITSTGPGDLPCQKIIHFVCPTDNNTWGKIVEDVLCFAKTSGHKSVSFPALGTGGRNRPPHEMMAIMLKAIANFSKQGSGPVVDVRVVVFENKILDVFRSVKQPSPPSKQSDIHKEDCQLPSDWTKISPDTPYLTVPLNEDSPKYKEIAAKFHQTCPDLKIIKIERIQSPLQYKTYSVIRDFVEKDCPAGTEFEKTLFHGTSGDVVESINRNGFNRSYCGKNATVYGQGVYFAVNAKYSAQERYSKPDENGNRYMYLCKVLTGSYTQGSEDMKVPTPRDPSDPSDLHHSVVDNVKQPTMFVVFHDHRAYPEYLITFR